MSAYSTRVSVKNIAYRPQIALKRYACNTQMRYHDFVLINICMNRKNLKVPFKDKERVKALGAKWDPLERTWYIDRTSMRSNDLTKEERMKFGKWLAGATETKLVEFTPTKWCPAFK